MTPTPRPITPTAAQSAVPQARPFPAGFFEDEAYVAPSHSKSTHAPSEELFPEAQKSYYNLLRHRFRLLRSTLRCAPPISAISALDDSHPISLPRNNETARKEWRRLVLAVEPQMAQLACMDQSSVLGVLGIAARELSDIVRSGDADRLRRMGAWAWGLLGKCREVGELATGEVGTIRDLGKRAVKISHKFREAENNQPAENEEADAFGSDSGETPKSQGSNLQDQPCPEAPEQVSDGHESAMPDASDQPAELEVAKARLQAKLQSKTEIHSTADLEGADAAQQTRALLDMVITIVGEFFGQRDLLEAREVWTSG